MVIFAAVAILLLATAAAAVAWDAAPRRRRARRDDVDRLGIPPPDVDRPDDDGYQDYHRYMRR